MRKIVAAIAFLMSCVLGPVSMATDYYVSGYATWTSANPVGNDSTGNGSSATPWATLGKVTSAATLAAGDRIFVAGIVFSSPAAPFYINNVDNVQVLQWPGATQAHVHGGVRAALSGWTRSTNRYNVTVGTGKVIAGVTLDYDNAVDANGMKRCWLKPAGQAGNASSATTVTWTASTSRLTKTGAFTNCQNGSAIRITGGTGATTGIYIVTNKVSNDVVAVHRQAGSTDQTNYAITIDGTGDTANTWFYDASGGVLYVNTGSASTSLVSGGADSVTYVDLSGGTTATTGNLNGVYAVDSDNIVVSGIVFSGFIGQQHTSTYYTNGVQFYTCNSSTVSNCTFYDNGIHAVSIAGLSCTGNRILNCTAAGLFARWGSGADGGNQYVFYSGGGDVYGCVGDGLTAIVSNILDPTGAEIETNGIVGGFYSHTDGAGGRVVRDVEWRNCTLVGLNGEIQPVFDASNQPSASSYPAGVWSAYPVRVRNSTLTTTSAKLTQVNPVAYRRCRFDLTPAASDPNQTGLQHNAGASGYSMLYEACDFTSRHGTNAFYNAINLAGTWTFYFRNCSFLLTRTTTTEGYFFSYLSSNAIVRAYNCIFSDASSSGNVYLCVGDSSGGPTRDFKNCAYFNIDTYSVDSTVDTAAEWRTTVDTRSQNADPWFPSAQPFGSASSASHDLSRSSGVFTKPRPFPPYITAGINGVGFSGHIGAWQYAGFPAVMREAAGQLRRGHANRP